MSQGDPHDRHALILILYIPTQLTQKYRYCYILEKNCKWGGCSKNLIQLEVFSAGWVAVPTTGVRTE